MRIIHPSREPPWRLAMRARTEKFLHEFLPLGQQCLYVLRWLRGHVKYTLAFSSKVFAYDTYNPVSILLIFFPPSVCAFLKGRLDITGALMHTKIHNQEAKPIFS